MKINCYWCKVKLDKDLDKRTKKTFCSIECQQDYQFRAIVHKTLPKCFVCSKLSDEVFQRICSSECQETYNSNPDSYCKNFSPSTSVRKTPRAEQRRILAEHMGRTLNLDEAFIQSCYNKNCINLNHFKIVTKKEAKQFWAKGRRN